MRATPAVWSTSLVHLDERRRSSALTSCGHAPCIEHATVSLGSPNEKTTAVVIASSNTLSSLS